MEAIVMELAPQLLIQCVENEDRKSNTESHILYQKCISQLLKAVDNNIIAGLVEEGFIQGIHIDTTFTIFWRQSKKLEGFIPIWYIWCIQTPLEFDILSDYILYIEVLFYPDSIPSEDNCPYCIFNFRLYFPQMCL